ncbi:hypothetical protein [uncultured Flavobacterium sp.]|nr:hypothetical protein [uncultured Flavobacterium sp.]
MTKTENPCVNCGVERTKEEGGTVQDVKDSEFECPLPKYITEQS